MKGNPELTAQRVGQARQCGQLAVAARLQEVEHGLSMHARGGREPVLAPVAGVHQRVELPAHADARAVDPGQQRGIVAQSTAGARSSARPARAAIGVHYQRLSIGSIPRDYVIGPRLTKSGISAVTAAGASQRLEAAAACTAP